MKIPCEDCITLAICKSHASEVYKIIKIGNLDSRRDSYAISATIERNLITVLVNKCQHSLGYITGEFSESVIPKTYKVENAIQLVFYLHNHLAIVFADSIKYNNKMYHKYLEDKNSKIAKEYNVN